MNKAFLEKHSLPVFDADIPIIGIAGRARVGKDTFMESVRGEPKCARLAAALKAFFSDATGSPISDDKEALARGFPCTTREWLENVGQYICRWDPLFWVRLWALDLYLPIDTYGSTCVLFVPDVRKPIEAEVIKAYGGVIVRVNRDSVDLADDPHPSTQEIDNIQADWTIDNNGTIEHFQNRSALLIQNIVDQWQ